MQAAQAAAELESKKLKTRTATARQAIKKLERSSEKEQQRIQNEVAEIQSAVIDKEQDLVDKESAAQASRRTVSSGERTWHAILGSTCNPCPAVDSVRTFVQLQAP